MKKRLENYNISITLTDEVLDFLIEKGYNQNFGARPLRRAIENYLEDPLSEEILQGRFEGKETCKGKGT